MTEDDDLFAAEYALGLLEGLELDQAIARIERDAAFRAAVAAWGARVAPMIEEVAPVQPPEGAWAAISSAIEQEVGAPGNVVQLTRQVRTWRMIAGGATALAASLALAFLTVPRAPAGVTAGPAEATGSMVALIEQPAKEGSKIVATWTPQSHELVMVVTGPMPSPAGHVHELWAIPAGGTPHSLGVMPATQKMRMTLSDQAAMMLAPGTQLAVSVEPGGGSPTGAPTGPVVAVGPLADA